MRRTRQGTEFVAVLAACIAAIAGCSGDDAARAAHSNPAVESVQGTPRKAVERFQVMLVASSGEDAPLSDVTGLDVDSEGRIYVADWLLADVLVLRPDGRYLRSIGRRGSGPGEFGRVSSVQVLPGDSLLVFDRQLQRLTVFPQGAEKAAYTILIRARHAVAVMRAKHDERLVAWYSTPYTAETSGAGDRPLDVLRVLNSAGAVERDSVLLLRSAEQLVLQSRGRLAVGPHPFGREAFVRLLPDNRLIYAWNDTVGFQIIGIDGNVVARFSEPHGLLQVTDEDLRRLEPNVPARAVDELRAAEPRTWPALVGMVFDDRGRAWLGVRTPSDESTEWAAYTLAGHYVGSAFLPRDVSVLAIRWPRLYGVSVDEFNVPTIVVYELSDKPQPRMES